jgi:polyphenol oxidase
VREIVHRGPGFELPLLVSDLLPERFRHGFSTRRGGVSKSPQESLNLAVRGDAAEALAENRRRFFSAAGAQAILFASQVHGADAVVAGADASPGAIAGTRADAVIAGAPAVAVGVRVADCVPVLIADVRTGAAAAVHAGWRGTVAGVVAAALGRMASALGTRSADVRLVLGPSIGPCCFEVGPEVVAAVEAAIPGARAAGAVIEPDGPAGIVKARVDLWRLNRMAAEAWGVPPLAVDVSGLCTSCDRARFFSYRRDRGQTGHLAAFIAAAS